MGGIASVLLQQHPWLRYPYTAQLSSAKLTWKLGSGDQNSPEEVPDSVDVEACQSVHPVNKHVRRPSERRWGEAASLAGNVAVT